jgi:hypothetical protein
LGKRKVVLFLREKRGEIWRLSSEIIMWYKLSFTNFLLLTPWDDHLGLFNQHTSLSCGCLTKHVDDKVLSVNFCGLGVDEPELSVWVIV